MIDYSKLITAEDKLEQRKASARNKRDALIRETDWTQLPDVPEPTAEVWVGYRQALRDVPQQEGFPNEINWPEKPDDP